MTYQDKARHNEAWRMKRKLLLRIKEKAVVKAQGSAKWKMYLYALDYGIGLRKLCSLRGGQNTWQLI